MGLFRKNKGNLALCLAFIMLFSATGCSSHSIETPPADKKAAQVTDSAELIVSGGAASADTQIEENTEVPTSSESVVVDFSAPVCEEALPEDFDYNSEENTEVPTSSESVVVDFSAPVCEEALPEDFDYNSDEYIFIPAEKGKEICAVSDGVVVFDGYYGGYGYTLIVEHDEFNTLYSHMADYRVKMGDDVAAGEVIGNAGSTGYTAHNGVGYRTVDDDFVSDALDYMSADEYFRIDER